MKKQNVWYRIFGGAFIFAGGENAALMRGLTSVETTMRFYPDLGVVMGGVNSYQADKIAEGLVSTWEHEK